MPRLSIVIPCAQNAVLFESTLASVLQNRPADCEVLVVQPRAYDDPYDLRAEVRFLEGPAGASTVDLINLGVEAATGAIVHVLSRDVEVIDGWTDSVLGHFDDPTVGSVSPLVVAEVGGGVVARSVESASGGRRTARLTDRACGRASRHPVAGPTPEAGFYRRAAVLDVGGFCPDVGEEYAGVDLTIALCAIGLRAVHEERSVVVSRASTDRRALSYQQGRCAERLFWRNLAASGRSWALAMHAGTVAWELLSNLYRPRIVPQMLGRALAVFEWAGYRRHRHQLQRCREALGRSTSGIPSFTRSDRVADRGVSRPRAAA